MTLRTTVRRDTLPLETPFRIARSSQTQAEVVVVRIEDETGPVGIGGAAPSARHNESADSIERVLPSLLAVVCEVGDPHQLQRIERRLRETAPNAPAARAAVSIACHDLAATDLGVALSRYWGLDPTQTPTTSFTIGIDEPAVMQARAERARKRGFDRLKVKLGTDRARERLEAVRAAAPGATLLVDANEAWTADETLELLADLAALEVAMLEQPVAADDLDGLARVYETAQIPIAVDEAVRVPRDVPRVADRCDIVNCKLMNAGGLWTARTLIATARAHGLEVLLGCLLESNASIAAACHLTPLVDYADLDGALLLAYDPYDGVPMAGGAIDLDALERPGTGVSPH